MPSRLYPYLIQMLPSYVGSSIDITERKFAEEALKASEDRYQNFIRQSTEGISRFELKVPVSIKVSKQEQLDLFFQHAYLAECNDAWAQMYGYQHSEDLNNWELSNFLKEMRTQKLTLNSLSNPDTGIRTLRVKK